MGRIHALEQFNAGLAPANWRRESVAEGIAFVHVERGIRLTARALDAESREPGLDVTRWRLQCGWSLGEASVSETVAYESSRDAAVEAVYALMQRINSRLRETDGATFGLSSLAGPGDANGPRVVDAEGC